MRLRVSASGVDCFAVIWMACMRDDEEAVLVHGCSGGDAHPLTSHQHRLSPRFSNTLVSKRERRELIVIDT